MSKDWTGNSKAVFSMLAASNHSETDRVDNDYYATPPDAVKELLKREKFNTYIWECAVGGGHIADVLKEYGYKVKSSDVVDRGYSDTEIADFLLTERDKNDFSRDIITNPPYSMATEFVKHALDISMDSTKVAMFLKIQFLESKKRYELFKEYPPKRVYVFVNRVNCGKNGVFVKEYPSLSEASRITGINVSHICQTCLGNYKSAGGFLWKYKE